MESGCREAGGEFVVSEVDDVNESVDCIAVVVLESVDKFGFILVVAVCWCFGLSGCGA